MLHQWYGVALSAIASGSIICSEESCLQKAVGGVLLPARAGKGGSLSHPLRVAVELDPYTLSDGTKCVYVRRSTFIRVKEPGPEKPLQI